MVAIPYLSKLYLARKPSPPFGEFHTDAMCGEFLCSETQKGGGALA